MRKSLVSAVVLAAAFAGRADFVADFSYYGPIDAAHARSTRKMICTPSSTVAANGRLWATWFAGSTPAEDHNSYVVLATSADGGETWKEVWCVDPDGSGPRRAFDSQVWAAPDGSLWWSWTDRTGDASCTDGIFAVRIADAGAEFAPPPPPQLKAHGVMLGNPFVLPDGAWGYPVSAWSSRHSSGLYASADKGATWHWRGGASVADPKCREFDEHSVVSLRDGTLRCISRTKGKQGGISQAFSKDNGRSWTKVVPFEIKNTNARPYFTRLVSGSLLLVKNGPLDRDVGRKELTAYLSRDDGKTWEGGLLLDARKSATYPNGGQRPDGLVCLTHDHDRYGAQHVILDCFTEEDVLAGRIVSKEGRLGRVVHEKAHFNGN